MSGGIYWLASYPKSGNTWFRAFLKNLQLDAEQPVQINELSTGGIASGRAWMDEILGFDSADLSYDEIDRLRPRVYEWSLRDEAPSYHKVHDAWTFLRNGEPLLSAKATRGVLYIVRNPFDVAISFANHNTCTIDQTIENMANPHFAFCNKPKRMDNQLRQWLLTWSQHVASYLDAPNIQLELLRYEDMKKNPLASFRRAAKFLQLEHSEEKINKALNFCDMDSLQEQESQTPFKECPSKVKTFFRKGIVGDWQEQLSESQLQRIMDFHGPMMQRLGYLDAAGQATDLIKRA